MSDNFIIANRTDTGRQRQVNEDSMVTFDSPNGRVIAVCDGMGGQAAGDVASRLACDIITDILTNNTFATPNEAITRACTAANQGILHRASQNPELEGMGSTCVILIVKEGKVYYGWIGDSRIYYITKDSISRISRDQSYVQQLVDSGQISAAEAESHPMKNEITNALGLATMTPPELGALPIAPEPGSVFLLCSDGLSGMVDDSTIENIVNTPGTTLQKRAEMLIERANANGGSDNITVQLVEFPVVKTSKSTGGDKSKWYLYGSIAAAVIILGIVIAFISNSGNKKDETDKKAVIEKIDTRKENRSETKEAVRIEKKEEVREEKRTVPKADKGKKATKPKNELKDKAGANPKGNAGKSGTGESGKTTKEQHPNEELLRQMNDK